MSDDTFKDLLGALAHELNNPLGAIRLHAELIGDRIPECPADAAEDLRESVGTVAECAEQITRAIAAFRGLMAPRSASRSLSIAQLIQSAVRQHSVRAERSGVRIALQLELAGSRFEGDARQLEAALAALVENAVDAAMLAKDRAVLVRAREDARGLACEVIDYGPGIPAPNVDRIFEPFFTTKRASKGVGLGLAMARSVARAHGGDVKLGAGESGTTRFELRLPAARTP